ncbi:aldehyde dehydrogenase family protein [Siccirubricoccus sp. KC 17139]|uniref:Aldehyde dehydrogenase n=1 Tax=Siccirubricoccus soli TaxID=2899147 RepID=A0ABT1D865_9PROT|nr:aldehyde dehydrogenase family protein [Siccirubricoccus soli]MCO6418138.1 aldehyde dehydrogenase family protein [Siccirubricoccus soli]MCP2684273.1 aldehyde dehydrogenase family protein [Siccirubricoccus soli]
MLPDLIALRQAEAKDGTLPIARRRALLAALAGAVRRRAEAVAAAADADFGGRSAVETLLADVKLVVDAAWRARRQLRRWARPRRVPVPFPFLPARAREEYVPKGIVGIMAPWNYPLQLALLPAIDALAAGNRILVKPSEAAPATAALLAEILAEALGPEVARCVQGGPEVAAAFAAQPFDHLVFTGGTETGRRVMQAAARNLVPVTLELGGKCPCLVLPGADLAAAARAILAGKALNAGQTCIAPDTVLLIGHAVAEFAAACRATGIARPETALANDRQAARLEALCDGARLTPLGADGPGRQRALALAEAPPDHPLLAEEIFGPVLAVQEVADLGAALDWVRARPAPLAIYLFGATAEEEAWVARETRSGAIVSGRCVDYAAFPALAFGGTGASGFGRRNGEAGFREFSLLRARVRQGRWSLARLLDPPRDAGALRLVRRLLRLGQGG